mmetsp:Transcript_25509/g.31422  ORF Transcript_25509/g.31422 Transcript_25509/m.31422 type:complete len:272 (+) Transcript_25509:523-1338(+)
MSPSQQYPLLHEIEVRRLREYTRGALQQSWDKVENLQIQCEEDLESVMQLENEIVESNRKADYWHKRYLDAEVQVLQHKPQHKCKLAKNSPSEKRIMNFLPRRRVQSKSMNNLLNPTLLSSLSSWGQRQLKKNMKLTISMDSSEEETIKSNNHMTDLNLNLKLNDRENTIVELEKTIECQVKGMNCMEAEKQCKIESQRIKEERKQGIFNRRQDFLQKRTASLEDELMGKDLSISLHKQKSQEYKEYIKELASELERVLAFLDKAKEMTLM